MQKGILTKPRYKLTSKVYSKIWFYKNSYLRRFYQRRAWRAQRRGLFKVFVLVAKNRKWRKARRYLKPDRRSIGLQIQNDNNTRKSQPRSQPYKTAFYEKQKIRYFYGNRKESEFVALFRKNRINQNKTSKSFFSRLESRLDILMYRRRLLPTIYACQQRIKHQGVFVNEKVEKSPQTDVKIGDLVSRTNLAWKQVYWDLYFRVFYRRWGFFMFSRRFYKRFKKKVFISFKKKKLSKNQKFTYTPTQKKWTTKVRRGRWTKRFVHIQTKSTKKETTNFSAAVKKYNVRGYYLRQNKKVNKVMLNLVKVAKKKIPVRRNLYPHKHLYHLLHRKKIRKDPKLTIFAKFAEKRDQVIRKVSPDKFFSIREQKKQQLLQIVYRTTIKNGFLPQFIKKKAKTLRKIKPKKKKKKSLKDVKSKKKYKNKKPKDIATDWERRVTRRFDKYRQWWRSRLIRKKKYPRLKGIHRYIPNYLQINFRTIQITKMSTPDPKDIYTGFRTSAAKVYSFFMSRGF